MKEIRLQNDRRKALVDDDDYDYVMLFSKKWYYNWGYIVAYISKPKMTLYLHKIIAGKMGLDISIKTDHKYKNVFDNRKSVLREANHPQSQRNRNTQSNNKLGIKNITFLENRNKYRVLIQKRIENGKRKNLFCRLFNTIEEAIDARDKALIEFHGDFASFD